MVTRTRLQRAGRYFYFAMTFVVLAPIAYGFSRTIDKNLIHPAQPRPTILYVHAFVFTSWLVFFVLQSTLVRTRNARWHRRVGWLGVAIGAAIPIVGVATALAMARFNVDVLHDTTAASGLVVPLFDMACFTPTFILAVKWRRNPELHRRLMLIATCTLTAAGWGRFPSSILPPYLFYGGVDLLILLGVMRDLVLDQRVHRVYLWVLPPFVVGQIFATYVAMHEVTPWLTIAHSLLR